MDSSKAIMLMKGFISSSQAEICEQWLIPKTTINTVVKECVDAVEQFAARLKDETKNYYGG